MYRIQYLLNSCKSLVCTQSISSSPSCC